MACKYYINNKVLNEQEIKEYIGSSYIKESDIKLTTLGDIADLLAYSNSKLILPGYEVEYTTPDNMKFKTYQEASNHISELAKNVKNVDLSNVKINDVTINQVPKEGFNVYNGETNGIGNDDIKISFNSSTNKWEYTDDEFKTIKNISEAEVLNYYNKFTNSDEFTNSFYTNNPINNFIEKNKEYEQSKEIIEEWKKVNNIQYNPEEIYSRGQEFSSVVGAYSSFDVNLMMQNLLSHIEDNEKAGGKFAISAFTKPVDKTIGHLEGGGGKIKFKMYPKSEDILWAANTDVYSGSVWDASEKVNKDKKSELLGVSYTKYPSLSNVNTVQPNLASIVDDLAHHHNELGISLNFSNFELEVDEDVPYQTKKIIENVNKILQQKRLEEINSLINKLEKELSEIEFIQSIYSKLDYNNSNTRKIINNLIKLCKNKYYPYDEDFYYMEDVFTSQIIEILKFKKDLNYPKNLEKLIDLIIIYSLTSSNHKSFRVFENYKEILKFIKKIILIKDERLYNILTNIFSLKFIYSMRNKSYSLIDNIIKTFNKLTTNKSIDLKIINLCFYALLERSSNQNNPQFLKANTKKITNVSISTCNDVLELNKILYDLNIINTKYTNQIIELYKKLQIVFKNNINFIDFIALFENKKEFKIKEFLNNIDINRIEKIKEIYETANE